MLSSLFGVVRGVRQVPVRDVRMVSGLHVVAGFVMLRGFAMVLGLRGHGARLPHDDARRLCDLPWSVGSPRLIIHQTLSIIK